MHILSKHTLVCGVLIASLSTSCKKSKDSDGETVISSEDVQQSIAGSYTAVTARIGQINIVGTETTPLMEYAQPRKGMKLADVQADAWDNALWSTTEVFNCFGPCDVEGHSNTPAQFVAQAINPERQASPLAAVQESVGILCLLSQLYDNTAGLPSAGSKTVSFTAELRDDIASACSSIDMGETDFDATVTVTDLTGTMYDKKIDFARTGQTTNTIYIRNNGKMINVGSFEGSADSVRRTVFSYNLETEIFRFELVGIDAPGDINKSLNFYRGFIDETSSEMRFTAVMGSNFKTADRWQNLSFLTINGQFGQTEVGATISRQDAQQTFENKFVCFKADTTTFVNNTGCSEDATHDRKSSWSYSNQLFIDIAAKTAADWKLTENTAIAEFDATTIFTLAPVYQ